MYLTRNQAYVQTYRGFESHPLRQLPNYCNMKVFRRSKINTVAEFAGFIGNPIITSIDQSDVTSWQEESLGDWPTFFVPPQ